jgi:hypothetical protein
VASKIADKGHTAKEGNMVPRGQGTMAVGSEQSEENQVILSYIILFLEAGEHQELHTLII